MGINDEMEEIGGVEEGMMPVFTVLKDGRVLKNIFLNEPPPEQEQGSPMRPRGEEKILVGRHPECHIVVDHPSISRFHLEIRVQASSRRISVVDLSSVHGTWISGNRLQPQVAMDLAEGDTMRIGASSRIYELHWIPQRTAFELDNHLVALPEARSLNNQDENSIIPEVGYTAYGIRGAQIPSAPPMPQSMISPSPSTSVSTGENQIQELESSEEPVLELLIASEIGHVKAKAVAEGRNPSSTASEDPSSPSTMEERKENTAREGIPSPISPPRSENRVTSSSLLSRRSKSISILRVHTGRSRERTRVSQAIEEVRTEETLCRALFTGLDMGEGDAVREETFPSDKENMTPEAFRSNAAKKKKQTTGLQQRSSLNSEVALDEKEEDDGFPSDKENCTPHVPGRQEEGRSEKSSKSDLSGSRRRMEEEIVQRRVGRIPFQSLMENPSSVISRSVGKIPITQRLSEKNPPASAAADFSGHSTSNCDHQQKPIGDGNSFSEPAADRPNPTRSEGTTRRWHMVADTGCFLDEESRRALQLLEGVRGTHLIVPRMVIRELDCLRRREGLFRKTPRVSSVLQWIEECMVKTSWWIHVQSSMESMPAAPTPPATPQAPPPPALGLAEILSPTADDHILDCAFLFRGIKNDGQLVLLTNEVSLKIKAMAEGLLCESPREFRESLVSPWSERFLWAESSPRGPTWSSADSVAPIDGRHHHRCCPATRRPAKEAAEGARGLKLILLHNSHYAQANLIK